jgi:cell wall-associated NlpC family hydrolase
LFSNGKKAKAALVCALLASSWACTPFQRDDSPGVATPDPGVSLVHTAKTLMGTPYRWGGTGPAAFDCSGLVMYVHRQFGYEVPRTAAQQYKEATRVKRRDLQPGDLVFFKLSGRKISHVGIYTGDDYFIHAPQSGGRVRLASLDNAYFRKRFAGAGRFYD